MSGRLKTPLKSASTPTWTPRRTLPAHTEWPSSRHNNRADLLFCDGHAESVNRAQVIDPKKDNPWRNRWNNDNLPHNEVNWTINQRMPTRQMSRR